MAGSKVTNWKKFFVQVKWFYSRVVLFIVLYIFIIDFLPSFSYHFSKEEYLQKLTTTMHIKSKSERKKREKLTIKVVYRRK